MDFTQRLEVVRTPRIRALLVAMEEARVGLEQHAQNRTMEAVAATQSASYERGNSLLAEARAMTAQALRLYDAIEAELGEWSK